MISKWAMENLCNIVKSVDVFSWSNNIAPSDDLMDLLRPLSAYSTHFQWYIPFSIVPGRYNLILDGKNSSLYFFLNHPLHR